MPSGCRTWAQQPSSHEKLPAVRRYAGTACIANVFGYTVDDYLAVIEQLNDAEGIARMS